MKKSLSSLLLLIVAFLGAGCNKQPSPSSERPSISVAISPYQDIAMIVNIQQLGLEQKYNLSVKLDSMPWENILPAVASSGRTDDVGFGSYAEYLTKEQNLNPSGSDPVLFIYPAYIFKGGSFVTFDPNIPVLDRSALNSTSAIKQFLSHRIGAQRGSIYEMMVYSLARKAGLDPKSLKIYDTPLDNGILATQHGSLDIASAGLTQVTEAKKRGGRVVLTMDDLGFADITGFIVKKSTWDTKKAQVESLIRMWFDSVDYVTRDLDHNSATSLEYLQKNAATKYTLDQYKQALSQEYFPLSVAEVNKNIIADTGQFSYKHIGQAMSDYLTTTGKVQSAPHVPEFIDIK